MTKEYRQVLRPFDGEGTQFAKGDVVETSSWKNLSKLIATRYLSSFTVKESSKVSEPVVVEEIAEVPSSEEQPKIPAKKASATKKVAEPTTIVE